MRLSNLLLAAAFAILLGVVLGSAMSRAQDAGDPAHGK